MAEKPLSKTQVVGSLAQSTGLEKQQVESVLENLEGLIESCLKSEAKAFNLSGLLKIYVHHKKATEERQGINPATRQPMTIAAKPATDVVKVRALKKLKEML